MSYAAAAASGPKQSPQEAAAPQPPSIQTSETASTGSLIDVDTPSVRTVPSDFQEQEVKTETQAARQEREDEAQRARAEADLAKKKGSGKVKRADDVLTKWFAELSDNATAAIAVTNIAALVGVGSFVGYKAWALYDRGSLGWKHIGVGAGVLAGLGIVEGVFGRYLYKGKKKQT